MEDVYGGKMVHCGVNLEVLDGWERQFYGYEKRDGNSDVEEVRSTLVPRTTEGERQIFSNLHARVGVKHRTVLLHVTDVRKGSRWRHGAMHVSV
jgi:hypothetical protein